MQTRRHFVNLGVALRFTYSVAVHRLHDLRHSFASRALALGESLPMIGKLLGHAKVQTTARYAHLGRNSVKVAAVRISGSREADMDTPPHVRAAP